MEDFLNSVLCPYGPAVVVVGGVVGVVVVGVGVVVVGVVVVVVVAGVVVAGVVGVVVAVFVVVVLQYHLVYTGCCIEGCSVFCYADYY